MLFLMAAVVACVAWTVTQEEVFRECRDYCAHKSKTHRHLLQRKFFYLPTCEYCFSHWVALVLVLASGYRVAYAGALGVVVTVLALVWIANVYMSAFRVLRLGIKLVGNRAKIAEREANPVTITCDPNAFSIGYQAGFKDASDGSFVATITHEQVRAGG